MPKSLAQVLTRAIRRNDGEINSIAQELGASWATVRSWASGQTVPRRRDLPAISLLTGVDLSTLQALRAADHARRLGGIPRIDTVEQAVAAVAGLTDGVREVTHA